MAPCTPRQAQGRQREGKAKAGALQVTHQVTTSKHAHTHAHTPSEHILAGLLRHDSLEILEQNQPCVR